MKIIIKGNEYEMKSTLRAMFIFEQIKGELFSIKTLMDEFIYFYSIIMANNRDAEFTFDEFIDEADNDPSLIEQYKNLMNEEAKKQSAFKKNEPVDDKKKF
ncbi:hypothetical protein [Phocaeicola paurosaccharolyticus]|uniref:hypothetical protein n=1 Tax=Phocaeicola paurosaccharolyticus TaxID=732242 RepID=UPI000469117D|nr:hypothetical protein [Phocaeicola paurosaccharolyticus]